MGTYAYDAPLYLVFAIIFLWIIILNLRGYELLFGGALSFFITVISLIMLYEKYISWIHLIFLLGSLVLNLGRGYFRWKYNFKQVKPVAVSLLSIFVILVFLDYSTNKENSAYQWYKWQREYTKEAISRTCRLLNPIYDTLEKAVLFESNGKIGC